MNKNICLLVVAILMLSAMTTVSAVSTETISVEAFRPIKALETFFGNYLNNVMYFLIVVSYNFFCFTVGYTYLFWFNDGGNHFYKCYYSVPYSVKYL